LLADWLAKEDHNWFMIDHNWFMIDLHFTNHESISDQ
jgi:hypothetical protein